MSASDDYRIPPFPALRAFHAAARHPRLIDAASELGVTESAVSHQIRKLEDHLRLPLFERGAGGLTLTPEGESYFAAIDPAFAQLAKATRAILGGAARGRVSLTLPPSLAMLWLIPRLGDFERACPEVGLNLVTTTKVVDLRRERIDLAIRYGAGTWPGVVAEFLMAEMAFPVCSPKLLAPSTGGMQAERAGVADGAKSGGAKGDGAMGDPRLALSAHRLITSTYFPGEWPEWARARGLEPPDLSTALNFDTYEQALEAAAQGLGWVMGRSPLVDGRLADGTLVAPFGARAETGEAGFYLCRTRDEPSAAARRAARWLKDTAAQQAPAELGRPG